ncbi:MAG: thioredoxin-dependent thiol peroxidase [Gorillibacterium sp.]|nr:thioredoxin-dependent thiol peroxidase [Gorillibacterium sp.]
MTIHIGDIAPDFALQAVNGETVQLSDFLGKQVILYFYPKDSTPGCTQEACDFRDRQEEFGQLDTVILGISPDPVKAHIKFAAKFGLPFLLLADEEHEVSKKYEVWALKKNYGKEYMGIVRSTFLVSKEGTLLKEWRKVSVKGHVEEALAFVKKQ